jgi:hypothetical protein
MEEAHSRTIVANTKRFTRDLQLLHFRVTEERPNRHQVPRCA